MPEANYQVGEKFKAQFAWRIPSGDFIRAIFETKVLHQDHLSDKYVVQLTRFLAGRQENSAGVMRPVEEVARDYWALVAELEGRKISLAFEADDTRPLWLRIETLTGEHNFFTRLNVLPENFPEREKWEKVLSRYGLEMG
jgi:hypothetical protein